MCLNRILKNLPGIYTAATFYIPLKNWVSHLALVFWGKLCCELLYTPSSVLSIKWWRLTGLCLIIRGSEIHVLTNWNYHLRMCFSSHCTSSGRRSSSLYLISLKQRCWEEGAVSPLPKGLNTKSSDGLGQYHSYRQGKAALSWKMVTGKAEKSSPSHFSSCNRGACLSIYLLNLFWDQKLAITAFFVCLVENNYFILSS